MWVPRIYVGLGSTGAKIVSRIKAQLDSDCDPLTRDWTYFLAIVSEESREEGVASDIDIVSLSRGNLRATKDIVDNAVLSQRQNADIRAETGKWWYWDEVGTKPWYPPVDNFATGCGGIRPCGRLLFQASERVLAKLVAIDEYFLQKYNDLQRDDPATAANVNVNNKICRVFGLLAGGTCSGFFLDFPLLVKHVFGPTTTVAGTFLLGDICYAPNSRAGNNPIRNHTQRANTSYALAELSLIQGLRGRQILYRDGGWPRTLGHNGTLGEELFGVGEAPYHQVALLGAKNQMRQTLDQFAAYSDFVARYYSRLLLSGSDINQERGDGVDGQAELALNADQTFPHRPNTIQLIGMLDVRMPTEKLKILAANEIITDLSTDDFFNNDPERYANCVTRFDTAVEWDRLYKRFEPPTDEIIPSISGYQLPEKAAQFRHQWDGYRKALDEHYASWISGTNAESKGQVSAFEEASRKVLEEILRDLMGTQEGKSLELGTLKYILNDFIEKDTTKGADVQTGRISGKLVDCQTQIKATIQTLYGVAGEGGLKNEFDTALGSYGSEKMFPQGLVAAVLGTKSRFKGPRKLSEKLGEYRDKLRDLAAFSNAEKALTALIQELRVVSVARKLIADYAAKFVFETYRNGVENIATGKEHHNFTSRDVISDKAKLTELALWVLESPADDQGDRNSGTIKARTKRAVAEKWAAGGQGQRSIFDAFREVQDSLRRDQFSAQNYNKALENTDVRSVLFDLRKGLAKAADEALDVHLLPKIKKLSVWDVLGRVAEKAPDRMSFLRDYFRALGASGELFTQLNGSHKGDEATRTVSKSFKFFYSRELAIDGFLSLLDLTEGDLDRIIQAPADVRPDKVDVPNIQDIVILYSETGHDPIHFEEFDDELDRLLRADPQVDDKDKHRWSDTRFPVWINEWAASR